MIDLSFLTDEEQEAILKVLQRDADLKRAEEERIRHLPEKVKDDGQVKNMSGQWFYEAKSKRHRDKIHGADIIRASIRRKPLKTEPNQSRSEKTRNSWVNNVNKEAPTPPGPLIVIEEESKSSQSPKVFIATSKTLQKPEENTKGTAVSPSKQRKNPFNDSTVTEDNAKNGQPENGVACLSGGSDKGQKLPLATKQEPQAPQVGSADPEQGSEEGLNPVMDALQRSSNKQAPSKSLEDIPSATSNKGNVNLPRGDLVLSAEDDRKLDEPHETNENDPGISTAPSFPDKFSHPEKVKHMSKSVPAFTQDEVSTSVMSVYSGDFGNVDVKGNIQFAIDYVDQLKEFHIFIAQGKDLAIADVKKQRSDPYVKSYLLPEKYKLGKRKTAVKKKTLNPVYNEILRYKVEKDLLATQRLNISVWHNDTFGRNSFLGEVELDLRNWDWNDKQNKQMNWYPLKPRTPLTALELENRGEVKLALQYIPQPAAGKKTPATGEVHIWVKECNDLPVLRGNKLNSFVKCTILPDTSRKSRQKTRAMSKTTNPVFNHTMVYDGFRPEDLKEACVELTVWDHNKLANHFIGGLRIGLGTGKSYGTPVDWMDSTFEESSLWERMIDTPNTWAEDTLPLRMLMTTKMTK